MPTRILVPPGIGDIYWVTVKLRSMASKLGWKLPVEATVVSYFDKLDAHKRGLDFIRMYPELYTIGSPDCVENDKSCQAVWDEAYLGPGNSIFPGVMGYDYFIAYNGVINSGGYLETCDDFECDWRVPPVVRQAYPSKFMLCFFPFLGTYESHERDFPIEKIAGVLNEIIMLTGFIPIFLGGRTEAAYDTKQAELINMFPNAINLVGRTSLPKVMQLVDQASLIFGYHSGIPNLGAAMGIPTVLLWDDRYPASTAFACVPPEVRGSTYQPVETKGATSDKILKAISKARVHARPRIHPKFP